MSLRPHFFTSVVAYARFCISISLPLSVSVGFSLSRARLLASLALHLFHGGGLQTLRGPADPTQDLRPRTPGSAPKIPSDLSITCDGK